MPDDGTRPQDRRWRGDARVPLRWLLVDESAMGAPDVAITVCADIEGLFVDSPLPLGETPLPPLRRAGVSARPWPPRPSCLIASPVGNDFLDPQHAGPLVI